MILLRVKLEALRPRVASSWNPRPLFRQGFEREATDQAIKF